MVRRKLKVYGGNLDGTNRLILATTSMKEFTAMTGIGRDWIAETGNDEEVAQAMSKPGQAFIRHDSAREGTPWTEFDR